MPVDRCLNCQYYDRHQSVTTAGKSANAGQCRREAPQLSPQSAKQYLIEGVWPTVRDDDWCGEWKLSVRRAETRAADALIASLPSNASVLPASQVLPVSSMLPRAGASASAPVQIGAGRGGDD